MWTKYLIIKLLCYFCVKVNWKETSSQTSACAAGERPRAYNLSHVPQLIHPAVFRHQTSLEVSGSAETVSCTSSATRFCTKHNSTHTKEKKKKNQAPGILRNIQIFTTVFSLITKSVTKAYSTLCTNSRQKQGGAIPWHSDTASMVSSLRSPPAPQLSRAVPPINRLWAGFQQDGASSSCAGTSFCYLQEAHRQSPADIGSQSKATANGLTCNCCGVTPTQHQRGGLRTSDCSHTFLFHSSTVPQWKRKR